MRENEDKNKNMEVSLTRSVHSSRSPACGLHENMASALLEPGSEAGARQLAWTPSFFRAILLLLVRFHATWHSVAHIFLIPVHSHSSELRFDPVFSYRLLSNQAYTWAHFCCQIIHTFSCKIKQNFTGREIFNIKRYSMHKALNIYDIKYEIHKYTPNNM